MPNVSSPLGTENTAVPLVNATQLGRAAAGLHVHFPTRAALNAAVTAEIANIAASSPTWSDQNPMTVSGESATYKWSVSGQHARNATLPGGKVVTLAAASNAVIPTSGTPSSGTGSNGDYAVDTPAGIYYGPKASGAWPGAAALVLQLPITIPFASAIPFTGQFDMGIVTVSGALAFTATTSGAVRNGSVTMSLLADGVSGHVPTFDSNFVAGGQNFGYLNTLNVINTLDVWYDGLKYYYAWTVEATPVAYAGPTAPAFTVAATLSSTPVVGTPVGFTYTVTGNPTPTITQQFTLDGTPISGATGSTYTPIAGQATHALGVVVTATNTTSPFTATSTSATATVSAAATVPGAPTGATATAGDTQATVTFTAPASNGGSTITGYTATSTPGGFTGSVSGASAAPITVTGLTDGTAYTFTVHATNAVGNSSESSASNSVTPVASATVIRFGSLVNTTESGNGTSGWNYTTTVTSFTASANADHHLPASTDASITFSGDPTSGAVPVISFQANNTNTTYGTALYAIYGGGAGQPYYQVTSGGSPASTGVNGAAGSLNRMRRTGTSVVAEFSTNGGTSWTTIYTWTGASTADLYITANLLSNLPLNNMRGVAVI